MTLFLTKNLYFTTKNSFISPFLVTSYFSRAFLNITFPNIGSTQMKNGTANLKYTPDTDAWAIPTSNVWGTVPSVPLKAPPMQPS